MPERVPVSIRMFTALIVLVCTWHLGEYCVYLRIAVDVGNVTEEVGSCNELEVEVAAL